MVDGGEPGVDSRDEGKHTGRNDLLFVEKMMWLFVFLIHRIHRSAKVRSNDDGLRRHRLAPFNAYYLT